MGLDWIGLDGWLSYTAVTPRASLKSDANNGLPGHEQLWNVSTKCFGHVLGANVGDALKSKRNVHRVPENGKNNLLRFILKVEPAGQVVLDGLHDELDQLRVSRYQNRDEEIALWEITHLWIFP